MAQETATQEMPTHVHASILQDVVSHGPHPSTEIDGSGPRVLVVDDNAEVRQMLGAILAEYGYSVHMVEGPREACRLVGARRFDAAVIDLVMPEIHGLDLLEVLRGVEGAGALPAVILSVLPPGTTREAATGRCAELGDADLLDKPVTARLICQAVSRLVGHH